MVNNLDSATAIRGIHVTQLRATTPRLVTQLVSFETVCMTAGCIPTNAMLAMGRALNVPIHCDPPAHVYNLLGHHSEETLQQVFQAHVGART